MIELIPAIDIIQGRCVRLTQGDYSQCTVYDQSPVEVAKQFEGYGFKRLHVVDLDGAKSSHIVNAASLEAIATQTRLTVDFGGGIKNRECMQQAFDCGASYVTIGSLAVKQPELFRELIEEFGRERIILGADVKDNQIRTNGWMENSATALDSFLHTYHEQEGIRHILCTDISKDGMLKGPSLPLYQEILQKFPHVYLIASGGVGSMNDIKQLNESGVHAVVFGKAIYEGRIDLNELAQWAGLTA